MIELKKNDVITINCACLNNNCVHKGSLDYYSFWSDNNTVVENCDFTVIEITKYPGPNNHGMVHMDEKFSNHRWVFIYPINPLTIIRNGRLIYRRATV